MASEHILLLAFGAKKTLAVEKLMKAEPDASFPVTFLAQHPNLTVILDEAAVGK
jgi:glucosamine-6-phosphate deaminase